MLTLLLQIARAALPQTARAALLRWGLTIAASPLAAKVIVDTATRRYGVLLTAPWRLDYNALYKAVERISCARIIGADATEKVVRFSYLMHDFRAQIAEQGPHPVTQTVSVFTERAVSSAVQHQWAIDLLKQIVGELSKSGIG